MGVEPIRLEQIIGKKIVEASISGGAFEAWDDRCLALRFEDGQSFFFHALWKASGDITMYMKNADDPHVKIDLAVESPGST